MIVRLHNITKKFQPYADAASFECDFVDIITDLDTYSESIIVTQDRGKLNVEYTNKEDNKL